MANSKKLIKTIIEISDDDDDGFQLLDEQILIPNEVQSAMAASSTKPLSEKSEIKVLSWNIDGLDEDHDDVEIRAVAVGNIINSLLPDVCLLQEVIDSTLLNLRFVCKQYEFEVVSRVHYFNIIMTKKDVNIKTDIGFHFPKFYSGSEMGRYLMYQDIQFYGYTFTVMTTHLESLKDSSDERVSQLRQCIDIMKSLPAKNHVIFAGDLNVREAEMKKVKVYMKDVSDAWESCGYNDSSRFTWDLKRNDNLSMGSIKPRARYDRMLFKSGQNEALVCCNFELVGTTRNLSFHRYPSDHFGILGTFKIIQR